MVDAIKAEWIPNAVAIPGHKQDRGHTPYIRWLDKMCQAIDEMCDEVPDDVPVPHAFRHLDFRKVDAVAEEADGVRYCHPLGVGPWMTSGVASAGADLSRSFTGNPGAAAGLSVAGRGAS